MLHGMFVWMQRSQSIPHLPMNPYIRMNMSRYRFQLTLDFSHKIVGRSILPINKEKKTKTNAILTTVAFDSFFCQIYFKKKNSVLNLLFFISNLWNIFGCGPIYICSETTPKIHDHVSCTEYHTRTTHSHTQQTWHKYHHSIAHNYSNAYTHTYIHTLFGGKWHTKTDQLKIWLNEKSEMTTASTKMHLNLHCIIILW